MNSLSIHLFFPLVLYSAFQSSFAETNYTAAVLSDFPPLYTTDKSGKPAGFAIDILERLSQKNHLRYRYLQVTNWQEAVEALRDGQADFIPGIGFSSERRSEFLFSTEMETVPVSIFVRKSNSSINSLADLRGKKVAVIKGSSAEATLKITNPDLIREYFSTIESALFSLMSGNVDAFIFPQPVLKKKLQEIGLSSRVKTVGEPVIDLKRGYLFRKEDSSFVFSVINPFLTTFTSSREYMDLYFKWYGKPEPFLKLHQLLFILLTALTVICILLYAIWTMTVQRVNLQLKESIQKLKEAEQELICSEEQYRILMEASPFGIVVASLESMKILFVNKTFSRMFGYTREEAVQLNVKSLHPDEEHQNVNGVFEKTLHMNIGESFEKTHECLGKNGTRFICDVVTVLIDLKGVKTIIGFFTDITESLKMEMNQRQSEKLLSIGQLAGGIAHDFNNQLAGILGYSDILNEELASNNRLKLYVENIRGIVKRASDLTKQLLAYARKGATVKQPIDIHSLIHEVTSLLHHSIDKKISIASLLTAHNSIVNGDPTQLQNVFLNLGLNARDAMPDGGEIRFETTVTELFEQDCCISGFDVSPGMYVQISVTDNGSGIPADIIGRVFEPFFTTKETGKGTGMGLAAVYGTVRGHHGIVKIISNVGHGTTVLVQLPILKETVENKEDTAPSSIQTVSGISILLADDEAIVRETASEMLKRAGHNVIVCTNGKEALDYFRTHQTIDLVILDMVMPIMNGLETFRAMKKIRSDVCAVLSSGYTLNDSVQNILDEGVMNFLQKPFRRSELLQVIQDTLGKGYVRTDVCSHP